MDVTGLFETAFSEGNRLFSCFVVTESVTGNSRNRFLSSGFAEWFFRLRSGGCSDRSLTVPTHAYLSNLCSVNWLRILTRGNHRSRPGRTAFAAGYVRSSQTERLALSSTSARCFLKDSRKSFCRTTCFIPTNSGKRVAAEEAQIGAKVVRNGLFAPVETPKGMSPEVATRIFKNSGISFSAQTVSQSGDA